MKELTLRTLDITELAKSIFGDTMKRAYIPLPHYFDDVYDLPQLKDDMVLKEGNLSPTLGYPIVFELLEESFFLLYTEESPSWSGIRQIKSFDMQKLVNVTSFINEFFEGIVEEAWLCSSDNKELSVETILNDQVRLSPLQIEPWFYVPIQVRLKNGCMFELWTTDWRPFCGIERVFTPDEITKRVY